MSLDRVAAEATAAVRAVSEKIPNRTSALTDHGALVQGYTDEFVGDYRGRLLVLLGAVGFVMLIACSNVANLLLARGSSRGKELAIRAALGAGRARLVRQLLTESVVLSLAGAVAGLGVAFGLVALIVAVSPSGVPRIEQAGIDWRVLSFTLGLGVASSLVFGLLPAIRAAGPRLQSALREGGRDSVTGRDRLRAVLVAAEVALAITLLVGSGLLIRSAISMQRVASRLRPARRVDVASSAPRGALLDAGGDRANLPGHSGCRRSHSRREVGRAGVDRAAVDVEHEFERARGGDRPPGLRPGVANMRQVSTGYFATMGIPLLAGRDVNDAR